MYPKWVNQRSKVSMQRLDSTRVELVSGIGRTERKLVVWDRDIEDKVADGQGWHGTVTISADDLAAGWAVVEAQ